jgi:DNA-binding XRE family transcriptional regulator
VILEAKYRPLSEKICTVPHVPLGKRDLLGEYEMKKLAADAKGNYPAVAALRAVLANKIIRRRRAAGLSQVALAKRAGIRPETLNRLEQGKHTPTVETINKIDRVLKKIEVGEKVRGN